MSLQEKESFKRVSDRASWHCWQNGEEIWTGTEQPEQSKVGFKLGRLATQNLKFVHVISHLARPFNIIGYILSIS